MSAKRLLMAIALLFAISTGADAQGILKRIKDKAVDAAKRKIENKVERETEDAMDEVLDGKKKGKKSKDGDDADVGVGDSTPDADAQNIKSDFVRGSVILFEDDFANESMGEFPSKWDIQNEGNAEVASINGKKYVNFTGDDNYLEPLMQNMKSYLPDVFTIEWDYFCSKPLDHYGSDFEIIFDKGKDTRVGIIRFHYRPDNDPDAWSRWEFKKPNSDDDVEGNNDNGWIEYIKIGQWNHFALSFNKRALKLYVNDNRVINLPNVEAPERFKFFANGDYKYRGFGHVILAAGAKDLYERNTTDLSVAAAAVEKAIQETGKFVTNNILFETGKATLKAESMEEIQKVAEYMKKNPTARFEVQGHTDNQGSDKINDPLSQQRAEAVVKALEQLGCDPFNMRAVGKGSHEPVADNNSETGRAKNRRVEFIKK